ncbi:DUF6932 family protein [Fibrella forsythiae]|uniref:Uncharacterized protein n=1 Tax=Fibrella forsythiae TaxID=2817061 RepID=A0ABS3JSY3_9BACT|nr:hypothetical protein [Fibrella forsythiae]MBO0953120.1 hypothetical protein [Fibrella forsythiae]
MPIPDFDHNDVLPPHLGDPRQSSDLSPYPCTTLEFCQKFSTSPKRVDILKKFIEFRQNLNKLGVIDGFQWLDGSFLENIEVSEKRDPNDLDLVTFFGGIDNTGQAIIMTAFPEFGNPVLSKKNFYLDHYPVDYCYDPNVTVALTAYWLQLFNHNRQGVWKGMIRLELNTPKEDKDALDYLNSI